MAIEDENWQDMQSMPKNGQRCRVLIVKEMVFEGEQSENRREWREDNKGEFRFVGWMPVKQGG